MQFPCTPTLLVGDLAGVQRGSHGPRLTSNMGEDECSYECRRERRSTCPERSSTVARVLWTQHATKSNDRPVTHIHTPIPSGPGGGCGQKSCQSSGRVRFHLCRSRLSELLRECLKHLRDWGALPLLSAWRHSTLNFLALGRKRKGCGVYIYTSGDERVATEWPALVYPSATTHRSNPLDRSTF